MKNYKLISFITALTITVSVTPSLVHASNISQIQHPPIVYVSGPIEEGTESIIAQDIHWKYGVTQPTTMGSMASMITGVLTMSGAAKITDNNVASYFGSALASFAFSYVFPKSRTVNIKFTRYIVQGADGIKYYKVYASYYNLDGTLINAKLVQEGRA